MRLCLVLVGAAPPARAQENPALYQATAIVTGTDLRQRPLGFAECLTEVLVKVSGVPRLRDDPAARALAEHADRLAASYSYLDPRAGRPHHDDQGTYDRSYELTVRFDPAKVDTALAQLGARPWQGARPLLTPLVLVRPANETPYYLSAENPRGADLRAAAVLAASRYGVGVSFPTEADLAAWAVIPYGFPAPLGQPGPGRLQIVGSLTWDVRAGGWVGLWRVRLGGVDHDWRIAGVGFDQAFADLVRGGVMLAHGTGAP